MGLIVFRLGPGERAERGVVRLLERPERFCWRLVDQRGMRPRSFFPGSLEARKTSEQVLVAVIQEATIGGVSDRCLDELV